MRKHKVINKFSILKSLFTSNINTFLQLNYFFITLITFIVSLRKQILRDNFKQAQMKFSRRLVARLVDGAFYNSTYYLP